MGEAKQKSRSKGEILRGEPTCIYCPEPPTQIEHMPPKSVFKNKHRPSGLEFAVCSSCNAGTSGSDAVVSFLARIEPSNDLMSWQHTEAKRLRNSLEAKAPGFLKEIFALSDRRRMWRSTPGGIIRDQVVAVSANGPIMAGHMSVFGSKLGMALFREHTGKALPENGIVWSRWYANGGMTQSIADDLFSILPGLEGLKQGSFSPSEQFGYRFNTDKITIVAALVHFQLNLHIFTIVTSDVDTYRPVLQPEPGVTIARPGEILALVPVAGGRFFKWVAD